MAELDSRPGTYILVLSSTARISLPVGRLEFLDVQPGYCLYVGSALGPGGLRSRVSHHLQLSPSPHWHIDYLRKHLPVSEVWYTYNPSRIEHDWADAVNATDGATIPLARFGASDCRCSAHLFHFEEKPTLDILGNHAKFSFILVPDA